MHPLVGGRLRSALRDVQYESAIGMAKLPYLSDHRVYGQALFPAAGYLEMALAAAENALGALGGGPYELKEMAIAHPLVLGAGIKTIQTIVRQGESGATFEILSAPDGGEGNWLLHVSGGIQSAEPAAALRIDEARARCVEAVDVEALYAGLRGNGLDYGPGFRSIESAWRGEGEAVAHLRLAVEGESYGVHPALLDGALQVLAAVNAGKEGATYLPVAVEAFRLLQRNCTTLWVHARMGPGADGESMAGEIRLFDETGALAGEVVGLRARKAARGIFERTATDEWLFETEWRQDLEVVRAADFLASPVEIGERVGAGLEALADGYGIDAVREVPAALERLSLIYAVAALERLGKSKVLPRYERLLRRVRQMVEEEAAPENCDVAMADRERIALLERYPQCEAEFTMLGRCGSQLAEALRGEVEGLDLVFPGGSTETAEKLYRESPGSRLFNELTGRAVAEAIAGQPAGRKLRIVEIGAGTGGTTAYILDRLPADRVEYQFTDIGGLFTAQAREKFGEYGFVSYGQLDIEKEPEEQGFGRQKFDIVIAANVLHATADLKRTLENVKQMLAPEGLLVLLEVTKRQRWL
ncbi:MAG: polyketide synthase dehydratase domain-containing protein, partial [Candidatus Sulfotelmatobacter sp.]